MVASTQASVKYNDWDWQKDRKKQTTPCQVIGALNAIFYLFMFFNAKNGINFAAT